MNTLQKEQIIQKQTCQIAPQGYYPVNAQPIKLQGVQKLKFISYNVWFDQFNFVERNQELRKLFLKHDPDFICLQEVTQYFIQLLSSDKELCSKYYFSSSFVQNYDVLILSKYPISFYCRNYNSNQGRNLLVGVINVNEVNLAIGTTHLESLPQNKEFRKYQLQVIQDELSKYPESIFMGDLNLETENESSYLPSQYQDTWLELHPGDQGVTFPQIKKRLDRVLLKQSNLWKTTKIEVIGKEPIPLYNTKKPGNLYEVTTPSDHYGLYSEITFIGKK
ncbi:endonuclease/exonuclease/phosphatase family protein (macronuclear) [Tetrahymena thermophila SB210]|uniref:Endonuclease/exonuclease/phosphatase family protein n=1 Tax=Tetrahymena thermophila (strain SB210) TaxID=312017 RepID=Q23AB1_TETTS|nr:endonuclease/exonuclease/phosphatase family protein [Tetrahymena thermophila SB210]EAR93581.1 endonuclease/exonuclease/phosphatase family protein [Tetrahymena thermophila SB210]|eukprot:XP_001013826.1 endonuclease/exonuclease/phosphatase family protein [Tetrahymena thermophila SB210]